MILAFGEVMLLCFMLATLSSVDATDGIKPNVLLIVADDLGYADVNFYPNSQSVVLTPNLRELAMGGVRLANHHVQPFCSPTRATIMVCSLLYAFLQHTRIWIFYMCHHMSTRRINLRKGTQTHGHNH